MHTPLLHTKRGHQIPFVDGCQAPRTMRLSETDLGPLEEQSVYLTAEPSLQPGIVYA